MTYSIQQLADMVQETRTHRKLYTDEEIFDLEMDRIFGKAWIFVGHESQIPKPGDYYTCNIGKQPVIMVRDKSGEIHVLFNRCTHRGAKLVNQEYGNARVFCCGYHGWTFATDGTLMGIPHNKGYENTGFDIKDPANNMKRVPRYGDYRGFVFASLSPEGPSLEEYLGHVATSIDNMIDRSPEGKLVMDGGVLKYDHTCNWKLFMDNLNDTTHPMVAHKSVGQATKKLMASMPKDTPPPREAEIIFPFGSSYEFFDNMGVTACAYGNGYSGGKTSIHADYSEIPGYLDAMYAAYGKEKTEDILSINRHNTILYPSMTLKGAIQNIRVVRPVAVNRTIIETWHFRLVGAPDEMFQRNILYSRLINSSGSMVGPDDLECYRRIQEGVEANAGDWVDMHRNLGQDREEEPGVMRGIGTSDLSFRNMYKAWKEYMTAPEYSEVEAAE
tara:strand:+ start:19749 stop:21077 length:1329 start_codon:yes stop_codon:yes gene_type:complete